MADPHNDDISSRYLSDPDVLLMLEFQKGDKPSFEALMRKYYARIFNFILRMTGSREAAEDLTQETFVRVYQSARNYTPKALYRTWLFTIAKNVSLNELRRASRRNLSLQAEIETPGGTVRPQAVSDDPRPDEKAWTEEKRAFVKEAIEQLPGNQRTAVILRRYEKFSYEEIAGAMDCSVSAVKSLLSRARQNLYQSLKSYIREDKS